MDTRQFERLGWKTFWIFVSDHSKAATAIGLLAVIASFFGHTVEGRAATTYLSLAFLLAIIITFISAFLLYRRWEYFLDTDALHIRKGVLRRQELAIPYRQIQNINIERSVLNQMTGTSSLVILTAGEADPENKEVDSDGVIPVIDQELARKLQAELVIRANIQKTVETTPPPSHI